MTHSKSIDTLIEDIYGILGTGSVEPSAEAIKHLSDAIAYHIVGALAKDTPRGELRGSSIGKECDRQSWYQCNTPEEAEELKPNVRLKFLFGHIHEELVLFLAEQSGHSVEKRQDTVKAFGVTGHIDAIIDGILVDVKSANSRGMFKFRTNGLLKEDPFGYMKQIDFYREALKDDATITDHDTIAFIAADKELGHLVLDKYRRDQGDAEELAGTVARKQEVVSNPVLPARCYQPRNDGVSGNLALVTECSYCPYKRKCWPGLRAFAYSNGLRFLTKVVREPDVPEIKI